MNEYTPKDVLRFWSKVDKYGPDDCWPYSTSSTKGYGRITWQGRIEAAYRVSYLLAYGSCPDDRKILHSCETPSCVNPSHLVLEPTDEERFWASVRTAGPDECWEWTAGRNDDDYGYLRWKDHKMDKAHRVAWTLANGPIPKGLEICHSCDNPPCCNAKHLFLGTHTDNIHDMIAKGRLVTPRGEQHGECKFSDEQVSEMRRMHSAGGLTLKQIGDKYGASTSTVSAIVRYKTRK